MTDITGAEKLLPRVEPLQVTDKFSRVGNALLFYQNGYNSDNADLALISFATCLESLFSTMEQELAFRLSLQVATFLADENGERREVFKESKEVYRIRSKVVHEAQVHKNSETAAIYLVEHIVPQAERLARRCLAKGRFTDNIPGMRRARAAAHYAKWRLVLGKVEGHETVSSFRIALSRITSQDGIRKNRSRARYNAIAEMASNQLFGRLAVFYPIFQSGQRVKLAESGATATVMDPWDEKQPEEVFGLFAVAQKKMRNFHLRI